MLRTAFLALGCCTCLISCRTVACASETTHSVAEVTPVFLSVGQVEYRLQLLPNKGGVRVTSSFHPRARCSQKKISTGTFVLKNDAYGVESQLRAIMAQGYKQRDAEQGAKDIAGEMPYISPFVSPRYGVIIMSTQKIPPPSKGCRMIAKTEPTA